MSKRRVPVDTIGINGARIWPKKSTIPVGYKFQSKFERVWEVVENCGGGRYKISSDGVDFIRSSKEIKNGQILHPFDRTVYGRGYLGIGEHTYSENNHRSDCWRAMFKRCYAGDEYYHTYGDTVVHRDWENFQNFAEWYNSNYKQGWDLDKDLKSNEGIKIYSQDTCCFLPPKLNKQLSNSYGSVPTKEGSKYRSRISFNGKTYELGRFCCWKNALCMQVSARFSVLEGELRELFGANFVETFWSRSRLDKLMERSILLAESSI